MEEFLREQAERESGRVLVFDAASRKAVLADYVHNLFSLAGGALAQSKAQEQGKDVGTDVVSDSVRLHDHL